MGLLDSSIRIKCIFGRAGLNNPDPNGRQTGHFGYYGYYWAAIFTTEKKAYRLQLSEKGVNPSYAHSPAYAFSLRCLAHGTAG